jgi:hypothetical protein
MTAHHWIRAFTGIALMFFVLGCGQGSSGVSSSAEGDSKQGGTDESKGVWVYNSEANGFSLRLPSSNWKQMPKKKHVADFWSNRFGSPMLAGVFSVKKNTNAEFQDLAKDFKEEIKKKDDLLVKPTIQEGKNKAGHPYVFVTLCEKGDGELQFLYVGKSYTWIEGKGVTVEVLFEGQAKMQSKLFQSIEYKEFEKAARTICLSVDKAKEGNP